MCGQKSAPSVYEMTKLSMKPPSESRCALSTAFAHAGRLAPSQILDALGRVGAGAVVLDAQIDPVRFNALTGSIDLAILNGRRFADVPSARELDQLLADCAGAPVGPLFDVAAARLPEAMSIWPYALAQAAFGRAKLVYFSDACGPLCGLPPGAGELD